MSTPPRETCDFCHTSDTNKITRELQRTPDGKIVAHINCMLYSPKVVSVDSQEDIDAFDFNIETVRKELERGKHLRCSGCKKLGATVGCNIPSCKKTYHYPCLIKAKGSPSKEEFVVYCAFHKIKPTANDSKDSGKKTKNHMQKSRKRKRLEKMAGKPRESSLTKCQNNAIVENGEVSEESDFDFLIAIDSALAIEENEEAVPSTSGKCWSSGTSSEESGSILNTKVTNVFSLSGYPKTKEKYRSKRKPNEKEAVPSTSGQWSSETSSEESDSILNPKLTNVFSLSGYPKTKEKYSSNRKPNEKLQEVLQTMGSQEKRDLFQIYSQLGGSQPTIEMASPQDDQNHTVTAEEDAPNIVFSYATTSDSDEIDLNVHVDPSRCSTEKEYLTREKPVSSQNKELSDTDKTPEHLPGINVHVDPSRCAAEEEHLTKEKPVSSQYKEFSNKMLTSFSKMEMKKLANVNFMLNSTLSAYTNIKDRSCMSILDASACSDNSIDIPQSPELSNGATRTIMPSVIENKRVSDLVGLSKDIRLPTQQIRSPNREESLSSQPVISTDPSKSVRPDTLERSSLDVFNEQPANNLGAQETSETNPSRYASVTETESTFCSPLTLEKDGNKKVMESDLPASQCVNRENVLVTSPNNEREGRYKGTIYNIVTPEQINAISRVVVKGTFCKQLKSIIPQLQSTLGTSKRNTTKDAEQRRDGQDIPLGSPNLSTTDQPENAENYLHEPLENQEKSDDHIRKKNLLCQEQSKSANPKRKLDFGELPPNKRVPQNEENLPERMEAPEKQNEYYTENETPASVESEHGAEHQSGPPRMDTPARSQLYGPLWRSKSWSGFQHKRAGYRDGIDGFGEAVAGRCRLMPEERQARYMAYVFYSADLFSTAQTLPEFDMLINSLRTVFDRP